MPRPMSVAVNVSEHDSCGGSNAKIVRSLDDLKPLGGRNLVRTDDRPHLIIKDFCGRARQRAQTDFFQLRQERLHRNTEGERALPDFKRRERVDMYSRTHCLDRAANRKVGRAVVGGVNTSLEADLDGTAIPSLDRTMLDFLRSEVVRTTTQIFAQLALLRRRRICIENSRCWCN